MSPKAQTNVNHDYTKNVMEKVNLGSEKAL